jgi:hypothetical protein
MSKFAKATRTAMKASTSCLATGDTPMEQHAPTIIGSTGPGVRLHHPHLVFLHLLILQVLRHLVLFHHLSHLPHP